jgi:hypothetical protein
MGELYNTTMIRYISGYPAKSGLRKLIGEFWGDTIYVPRISGTYKYSGCLVWERDSINLRIHDFIDFLKSKGIEVERFNLHVSPTSGTIILKRRKRRPQ